jgi:hypothetical protein
MGELYLADKCGVHTVDLLERLYRWGLDDV